MKSTLSNCALSKTISRFAVLSFLLLAPPLSQAAPVVDSVVKLIASDADTNQFFGSSVAIDNGTAAVGAPDLGHGSVYTFTGGVTNWTQTQKLVNPAPNGAPDAFGASIALQNDVLVVGQPNGNPNTDASGQAFVYRLIGGTWVLQQVLSETNPPFPVSGFGTSVSVSGDTIAVGNPQDPTGPGSGSVSIYTNNGTTWNLQAKVTAPAGTLSAFFGNAVAVYKNTLLVGAIEFGISGAAFVFTRTGTTWTLQQILTPTTHTGAGVGSSVALEGDTAVVGAPGEPTNGVAGGAAFIFHRTGGTFILQ